MIIINFFINFVLLEITAKFSKRTLKTLRIILASSIGALYSLVIFIDDVPNLLLSISKIIVCMIMIAVCFEFSGIFQFIKNTVIFYFASMIFLGFIIAVCFLLKLKFVAVNNSIIYFNISAPVLILSAFASYVFCSIILRLYNRSLSKKELYVIEITNNSKTVSLYAFLDTGNRLREPFSNMPVIIVDGGRVSDLLGDSKTRVIPANTVNGNSVLIGFKPELIKLKSTKGEEVIENAYIGLSENWQNNNYSAILNYDILSV